MKDNLPFVAGCFWIEREHQSIIWWKNCNRYMWALWK